MNVRVHRSIKIPIPRLRFVALYFMLIFTAVLILSSLDAFKNINEQVLNFMSRSSTWPHEKSKIMGVEISEKEVPNMSAEKWSNVLSNLNKAGAETIVITAPIDFTKIEAALFKNVIIGLPPDFLALPNNNTIEFLNKHNISWGIADPWQDYRAQNKRPFKKIPGEQKRKIFNHALFNNNSLPNLDSVVYSKYHKEKKNSHNSYRINTIEGYKRIPIMSLIEFENALNIENLLQDKIVILGHSRKAHPVLSHVNSLQDPLTQTHFWALALDSLVMQSDIKEIHPIIYSVILFLFMFSIMLAQMYWGNFKNTLFLISLNLATYLIAWKSLEMFHIFIPMGCFFTSTVLIYCSYSFDIRSYSMSTMDDFNYALRSKINALNIDYSALSKQSFWDNTIKYFLNNIDLKRVALLEIQEANNNLSLLASYRCTEENLNYQIENINEAPYLYASNGQSPHPLSEKAFKENIDSNLYFLIPLKTSRSIYGYIYLAVDKDHYNSVEEKFFNISKMLSTHILQLLIYKRQELKPRKTIEKLKLFLRSEFQDKKANELETLFMKIDQNFDFLSTYAYSISSSSAVYDLFGNLIFANRSMKNLMLDSKLSIEELNASMLISEVTGMDKDSTLSYLRNAILDKETVVLPAMLSVPHKWRKETSEYIEVDMRISTIQQAKYIGGHSDLPIVGTSILVEVLQKESSQAQEVLNENTHFKTTSPKTTALFENLFTVIVSSYSQIIEEKSLSIEVLDSLDFEFSGELEVFKSSLDFYFKSFLMDAKEKSSLYVSAKMKNGTFKIILESDGYGMVKSIDEIIKNDSGEASESPSNLKFLNSRIKSSHLDIKLNNALGLGANLILTRDLHLYEDIDTVKKAA